VPSARPASKRCPWKERFDRLPLDRTRGEPRATHRQPKRRYKKRLRMPSKLDQHASVIENWLAAEPQLTAIAITGRLAQLHPDQFSSKQHSTVQRLLRALRKSAARKLLAEAVVVMHESGVRSLGAVDGSGYGGPDNALRLPPPCAGFSERLDPSLMTNADRVAMVLDRLRGDVGSATAYAWEFIRPLL
jgi:hypothetical protein